MPVTKAKSISLIEAMLDAAVEETGAVKVETGTDQIVLWSIPGRAGSYSSGALVDIALDAAGRKLQHG